MGLWASAVQCGSPVAVTEEGDSHPNLKKVLVEAKPEDIVTFMSVAGLPARAVRTPWLANYLEKEEKLQRIAKKRPCTVGFDCLASCGLRDGIAAHGDRKSVVSGKSVVVRFDLGGRRLIKKQT